MRLSLGSIAAVCVIALTQVASAVEQKGQGCDVRGVQVPGCEPGKSGTMQPTQKGNGNLPPDNSLPVATTKGTSGTPNQPHSTPLGSGGSAPTPNQKSAQ